MSEPFVRSIEPRGILSFAPDQQPIQLSPLNVVIGPNGSGKSNLIEIFELLKAAPTDLPSVIRDGGGAQEWLWKGERAKASSSIEALFQLSKTPLLRYHIEFGAVQNHLEILDEFLENAAPHDPYDKDVYFYYRLQGGRPVINTRNGKDTRKRRLNLDSLEPRQSVLAQRKDPDLYPELTATGQVFAGILNFREWSFGRYTPLRQPQPADLMNDVLLPDVRNLGLVLNNIEHSDASVRLNGYLRRFLPRFDHLSVRVQAGTVQLFLHETGLRTPVPATRLSDGTIRFIALLVILLAPTTSKLICIEEPELGLHPDALAIVAELLTEASQRTQILVTTQSDVLVSALTDSVESVLVCENENGASRFNRLHRQELEHWLDQYRLGDLWRMGELGGNP